MSLSLNYPLVSPSLLLDFANTEQLDPRITFTRASTASFYNGVTTAKAEENLLLQSQTFNVSWANGNTTDTINAATAPDGTTTAATLNDGVATGQHDIGDQGGFVGIAGVTYTASAFFKNVDRQFVILACSAGINTWVSAKFDLVAGTAGSTSASGAGYSTTSSSITSVGNGWYRCTITFVWGATVAMTTRLGMATDATTFTAGLRGLESYTGTNRTIEIWGAQLEQRSSVTAYTPTTTQPITNYIPVLLTAQNNVARFDHNPITGESLGLEIEEARTNLLLQSENFSTTWTNISSTEEVNIIVAPDGTLTGDKLVENTSLTAHGISQNATVVTATTYTASFYAKAAERTRFRIRFGTSGGGGTFLGSVDFDLSTGTVSDSSSVTSSSITPVGNGWYRCTATDFSSGTTLGVAAYLIDSGTNIIYTGDGYSGVYLWGAQLEAGAFATSYTPTVASQVTRSADSAVMTGTNFSSWYRQDEGTFYASYRNNGIIPNLNFGAVIEARFDSGNRIVLLQNPGQTTNAGLYVQASSIVVVDFSGSLVNNTLGKVIGAYKTNDFAGTINGASVSTDTSGTLPSPTRLNIGSNGGSVRGSFTVDKIAYYPLRITNAQLQALTGL